MKSEAEIGISLEIRSASLNDAMTEASHPRIIQRGVICREHV
jgi:hypothetical protein